jgi:hypothetical protein
VAFILYNAVRKRGLVLEGNVFDALWSIAIADGKFGCNPVSRRITDEVMTAFAADVGPAGQLVLHWARSDGAPVQGLGWLMMTDHDNSPFPSEDVLSPRATWDVGRIENQDGQWRLQRRVEPTIEAVGEDVSLEKRIADAKALRREWYGPAFNADASTAMTYLNELMRGAIVQLVELSTSATGGLFSVRFVTEIGEVKRVRIYADKNRGFRWQPIALDVEP